MCAEQAVALRTYLKKNPYEDGIRLAEKLMVNFPAVLQKKIEVMLLDGSLPVQSIVRVEALSQQLDASRTDVALVLASAYRKGLVEHKSADSYVVLPLAKPSIESVFQHTARMGFKPTTVVREVQILASSAEIADRLSVKPGEPVYLQVRSRLVEGRILANQHNYLPIEVCPGLESQDLSRRSFQETLEQDYHAIVVDVEESCRLIPANQEDRQILGLAKNDEVVVVQRLSLSATRRPLVWADIHVRIDRIDYVAALWPNAARLIKEKRQEV
jgi:DNA-binding GntR family transcriptional regulator